jgi:hypothetical protein
MITCEKCGFGHQTEEEFRSCKSWSEMVADDRWYEKVAELIATHAAYKLAGAVPQEELREVIEKWRKLYPATMPESAHYQGGRKAIRYCADELELLVKKRRDT